MAGLVVIDTDILIDASRAVGEAIACLDQVEDRSTLAVSAVTEMELVVGCRDRQNCARSTSFWIDFKSLV